MHGVNYIKTPVINKIPTTVENLNYFIFKIIITFHFYNHQSFVHSCHFLIQNHKGTLSSKPSLIMFYLAFWFYLCILVCSCSYSIFFLINDSWFFWFLFCEFSVINTCSCIRLPILDIVKNSKLMINELMIVDYYF